MEYTPKKVFVLDGKTYLELSYAEFRQQKDTYHGRRFIPLHGMLMEVPEDAYKAFYKRKRREKYLKDRSKDNGDFSYDMLTTDEPQGVAVYHGTRQHHDDAELLRPCDLRFRKGRNGASGGIAESVVLLPPYYFWIQNYAEKHQDMPSISRYDKWRKSLKIQDLSPFAEI